MDHFTPIAIDFSKTFAWRNFILVCPECNRRKSARFPLDAQGSPLVIDPTLEDPWEFLILDTKTGYIAARFLEDDFDPKGECTIDVLPCVNHEAVIEGRRRVIKRYYDAVDSVLSSSSPERHVGKIVREIREDEYGIGEWFARWEGREDSLFSAFREQHPEAWKRFVRQACRS
ncbi:HNH endonuclease [Streptomyces sp. KD18]|nr:HNH endonuclease [Streptomyces sp. KD18]GGT10905.1 hypothetical protein GCM10010286_40590 [Streptomyces toxytricini]